MCVCVCAFVPLYAEMNHVPAQNMHTHQKKAKKEKSVVVHGIKSQNLSSKNSNTK